MQNLTFRHIALAATALACAMAVQAQQINGTGTVTHTATQTVTQPVTQVAVQSEAQRPTQPATICPTAETTAVQDSTAQAAAREWTLEECIDYARSHNIQVESARVAASSSEVELEAAKASRYPTLSFSSGQNVSHQSAIKLINDYGEVVSDGTFSYGGSYGFGSTTSIFQGGRLRNNVRRQQKQLESSRLAIDKSVNAITIDIAQAYLQVLYARETVDVNRRAVELAEREADRAQRMLDAGAVARTEAAQMRSQLAAARYDLTSAENNLAQYTLQLRQLLELGIEEHFAVAFPEIGDAAVMQALPTVADVYEAAVQIMPETRSAEVLIEASEYAEKAAKAGFYPQISLSANVSTGHQSGTSTSMGSQLKDKLNESIGLSLSVPIFNNKSARTSVRQARLNTRQAQIDNTAARKELLATVESLHHDATAAQANYLSSGEKLAYAEESYRLAAASFEQGRSTAVELITEKNNYLSALSARLQAKYQAVLAAKILMFYKGEPIELR